MLRDQTLEGGARDLLGAVEGTCGTHRGEGARVEPVELGVGDEMPLRALGENRQAESEQQVLQDLEVGLDRLPAHPALPSHLGQVQHGRVGEADRFQEPREGLDPAYEALQLHLLSQVEGYVGAQRLCGPFRAPDERNQALTQGEGEVEARAQLSRHEGVERPHDGAAGKQIDAGPLELARARSREHDARAPGPLGELVHDVEQGRRFLNLVDDHHALLGVSVDELAQSLRSRGVVPLNFRRQEVDPQRICVGLPEPGRLARAPGAEKEEMPTALGAEETPYRRHFCFLFYPIVAVS